MYNKNDMKKSLESVARFLQSTLGQWLVGLFICLFVLVFSFFFLLDLSIQPRKDTERELERVVLTNTPIQAVEDIELYNGQESYYSFYGKDEAGNDLVALVSDQDDTIYLSDLSAGIEQGEAESRAKENGATQIERAVLGVYQEQLVWEVKSEQTYYLISFESGDFIKKEGL